MRKPKREREIIHKVQLLSLNFLRNLKEQGIPVLTHTERRPLLQSAFENVEKRFKVKERKLRNKKRSNAKT